MRLYIQVWNRTQTKVRQLFHENEGTSAVEYGLIALLVSVLIVVVAQTIGGRIGTFFSDVESSFHEGDAGSH
jgi:Flp pilus assembly pilin Flp